MIAGKHTSWKNLFASRTGVIMTGVVIGIVATLLQKFGNPPNMGICVACFTRDTAGALGLHRAEVVQYLRPEILGIIVGATLAALLAGEFKARAGSVSFIRFMLGAWAMIGALVFLGCPWRTLLRIAGGDLNAVIGLGGLVAGIWLATRCFVSGYDPGPSRQSSPIVGWAWPLLVLAALGLVMAFPPVAGQARSGLLFCSVKGPGSMHAPLWLSLASGVVIGGLLQRSRFCTIGGFRDWILFRQTHLLWGTLGLVVAAAVMNLLLRQCTPGFHGQPIAHTMALWNFLGMTLAGLAFTLAGGCPGRQCVLAGEGDADAATVVCGMLVGAAFAHNFALAGSPQGVGTNGQIAVVVGLIFCGLLGIGLRAKK